jgi:ATP-dependent Lhr-like helicase
MPAESPSLAWAHPLVRDWFVSRFGTPTEPQEQGWPHIVSGRSTLISAPTGSGKTLAAFLACIDRLVRKAIAGELTDRTEVLYVSPLKALGNDIQKNLEQPLAEIIQLAVERGFLQSVQGELPGVPVSPSHRGSAVIRTAVRTGDTLMHERRAMLKRPPHILVTTPESLYILLTAEKSRAILRDVETVIVDEIHAVADDKRGAHLALSLERLEALTKKPAVRIGLSATQKPLEVVAQFLTGNGRAAPALVNIGHRRQMDVAVEVPQIPLGPVASNEMWDDIYDRLAELARQHRSTLIFVNTRRLSERVSHNLAERLGEDAVAAHHGSLSRKLRLNAERKLTAGEIKALVATASLELGIDIGAVDLVCQIGSPRSIGVALQRVGRAGHWRGALPKGRLFCTTRDELLECAALVRAIRQGELDQLIVPEAPLDILAQQIVAACAAASAEDDGWKEGDLFAMVKRAYPYRNLARADFEAVIEMLSEGIAARRGRYGAYLHRDQVHGRIRPRRGARLAAITSGGAIPETALYTVIAEPEGTVVGTVDEDFAVESLKGDIILLGNSSWRIRRVEAAGRVLVEDAHGAPPSIPFWLGEAPARTAELSSHISELRQKISELTANVSGKNFTREANVSPEIFNAVAWLKAECGLDDSAAEQAVEYVVTGRAVLGQVPGEKCVIAERFFDEAGGMQLVIHAPFGARINKAWGLALRKRFCVSFNFELQAAATDNGLNISLSEQHSFPLRDVFHFLSPETVKDVLQQAALLSPIFTTRFRWDANRSLALLRFQGGKKVPPPIQRMRSEDLLAAVFPEVAACQENVKGDIKVPEHPLVREVMKDVFQEAMDLDGLRGVLQAMRDGSIQTLAVDTPVPSVFSHEILNANPYAYLDDAPLEERRARAVQMRRSLPESVLEEIGKLDPAAVAQVREEAWPDVRDAEELADVLHSLIAVPEACGSSANQSWQSFFSELVAQQRAVRARVNDKIFWVAAERAKTFVAIFPEAVLEDTVPQVPSAVEAPSFDDAVFALITGWMAHAGPTTSSRLAGMLSVAPKEVEKSLLRLESSGSILRGKFFEPYLEDELQWCERRLLARIHRLTLGELRKQVEPVTAAQFMRWLLRWQHVAPGTQLAGTERGTLEALRQLQGFEVPANAWERDVLARRVSGYDPKILDQLCLTGVIGWGRLSPHPATLHEAEGGNGNGRRRVIPTSVAPITFFVREQADWMLPPRHPSYDDGRGLSPVAREVLQFLTGHGASFFADIVRGAGKLKAEIETGLWELVAAGYITADGFDNLRALIHPRRRAGQGAQRSARPRHSAGRWALLYAPGANHEPDHARAVEATCRMLLDRYGVVFREVLAREALLPKWRELLQCLRRLEDRGEVRGGRFVSGFIGEQFALPVALESLRAMRGAQPSLETASVSAADPLNLVGIIVPGERVPAISGRFVSFRDGVAVAADGFTGDAIPTTADRLAAAQSQ